VTTFKDLQLIEPLQRALAEQNYVEPTPIQLMAIPPLLEGRDVLGCAQTGTGKTAAFSLPVLQHMAQSPSTRGRTQIRCLVLTPTRELAAQIGESLKAYGRFLKSRHLVIYGGVNENPQIKALRSGVDILVATPGRLLDLTNRGFIDLSHVDFFVLDEADRMLDMGFVHDVRRVMKELPAKRQNLLFSATLPQAIIKLAGSFLHDPIHVEVNPESTTVERIEQTIMYVDRPDKQKLLRWIVEEDEVEKGIVFTRTKHGANRLSQQLEKSHIRCAAIHGNKSQGARNRALAGFKNGEITLLIATDLASRGIDIDDVSHVFNYDLPNEPESYVHRIGRTARAGKSGVAISFCDPTEGEYLWNIEKLIGMKVPVDDDHDWHCKAAVLVPGVRPPKAPKPQQNRGRGRQGGGRAGGSRPGGTGNSTRKPGSRPSGSRSSKPASASRGTGGGRRGSGNKRR
jgi:ATP-dependent RNA helicase RhlE